MPSSSPSVSPTMPAAVFQGIRDVTIEELETPAVGPRDVLLEVSHCGICGSDLHFVVHWPGAGKPGSVEGHEFSGTVAAVGSEVDEWQVGDRVVGGPSPRCGRCEYCLAHRPSLCLERGQVGSDDDWMGAFARYKRMRADQVLRVPDNVELRHAALVEPL